MRRIVYHVACSLDGFIAGPNGEIDWITEDPEVEAEMAGVFSRFDTLLIGRRTFDTMVEQGWTAMPGMRSVVVSATLRSDNHAGVTVIADPATAVRTLRSAPGKDIWLFGGGQLFRSLLDLGEVDAIELAVCPVLLGDGVPLLPPPYTPAVLLLTSHRVYSKSGFVSLSYDVKRNTRA